MPPMVQGKLSMLARCTYILICVYRYYMKHIHSHGKSQISGFVAPLRFSVRAARLNAKHHAASRNSSSYSNPLLTSRYTATPVTP